VICSNLDNNQASKDPDEAQRTQSTRQKFVWSTPSLYASTLALTSWPDIEAPAVGQLAGQLQQFQGNLSSTPTLQACATAGERLSQQFQLFKDSTSSSSPVPAIILAVGEHVHAPLWFCPHGHQEDMTQWDGEPTLNLEAGVCELRGKTAAKKGPSRKITAPVAVEQFPGQSRRADPTSDPNKGLVVCSYKNQLVNTPSRNRGALPPARGRRGTARFVGLRRFDGLAHLISWPCCSRWNPACVWPYLR